MKEQDKYHALWHKRNELHINDNAEQDWLDMQSVLDAHMPVNGGAGNSGTSYLSGFKLLTALVLAAAAAVILYYVFAGSDKDSAHGHKTNTTVISANKQAALHNPEINNNGANDGTVNPTSDNVITGNNADTTAASPGVTNNPSTAAINTTNAANHKIANTAMANAASGATSHNNASLKHTNATIINNIAGRSILNTGHATRGTNIASHNSSGNTLGHLNKKHYTTGNYSGGGGSRIAGHVLGSGSLRGQTHGRSSRESTTANNKTSLKGGANDKFSMLNQAGGAASDNTSHDTDVLSLAVPQFITEPYSAPALPPLLANKFKAVDDTSATAKKPAPTKSSGASKFEYGLLAGVNAPGSFTAKAQNANFYGSLPVDLFFGAFTTYNFNSKWGINLQLRGLNPQNISGTYTHSNDSKKDTNQVLNISDSRKVYTADAALHLIFKPALGLSLKAGPVFSYSLKEANGKTTFQTGPLKKDSVYYVSVIKLINATSYTKGLNIGLSVGASYQYGRFIFDAAYIKKFSGTIVSSTLGSYTAINDQLLFGIGFMLSKPKK